MQVFAERILEGKTALVTGGGSGIGAGIAQVLARQGARVALAGRRADKLDEVAGRIRGEGGTALTLPGDVRDWGSVSGNVERCVQELGSLDIVINGAAGNFPVPASQLSSNGFKAVMDIDLLGTFNVCRAAFEPLSRQGGAIVSITATQAFVPTMLQVHVGAAKAGIEKMTKDLALEWGPFGIRVNTIAPGPVEGTEGMSRLAPGEMATDLKKRMPLGRYASIEEIAHGVLFLVSPAGSFITGAMLLMDGGMSLVGSRLFD